MTGPVLMSRVVAKAIGGSAGAAAMTASSADGAINAILHKPNDGADKTAAGGCCFNGRAYRGASTGASGGGDEAE